jgi:hypothetical protein
MNTMHQLGAAVFVGSCALHPGAGAQPQLSPVEVVSQIAQLPLAQLEAGYLQCDRVSSSRVLKSISTKRPSVRQPARRC